MGIPTLTYHPLAFEEDPGKISTMKVLTFNETQDAYKIDQM